jgi:uncharacterized protein (DUF305 family)
MIAIAYSLSKVAPKSQSTLSSSSDSSSSSSKYMNNIIGEDNSMMGMDHGGNSMMGDSVKDDQSFLQNMIPHHEEAVTSSKLIVYSTKDPELKLFAQGVIDAQTKEINQMKSWYKEWFGKDYVSNGDYVNSMDIMNRKTLQGLDRVYVSGMIMHHREAVNMADRILEITKRPELSKLANNIIITQTAEIDILSGWLKVKYNDGDGMMGM